MVSLITTCPGCGTAFRVTPEQIAMRRGMVRCGSCAAIFDARASLETRPPEPAPEASRQAVGQPPQAGAVVHPEPARSRAIAPVAPDSRAGRPGPADASLMPSLPAKPPDMAVPAVSVFPAAAPVPARRVMLWLAGCILLALALMTQLAFHYRSEIAVLFPEMQPLLAELCTSLGCDVPLPRRAQLISIESSDLQADPANPGVMVLTATLRNRAAFAQSHPSLELTLTDSQDQPLARRVLAVQDYLGPSVAAEAGFPGNSELPLKVYMDATSLKATGYRLYLFFP